MATRESIIQLATNVKYKHLDLRYHLNEWLVNRGFKSSSELNQVQLNALYAYLKTYIENRSR